MKKNIFLITLITIFSLFLASCVKEGPVVPAGADGQDGTNGTNGNANVTTTIFTNVVWQSVDTKTKMATITVPTINQDIVNKGTVLVAGSPDQQDWYAFPRDYAPNLSCYIATISKYKSYSYSRNKVI